MSARGARLVGLILAIALGQFLFLRLRSAWINYWLLRDAQKGTAIVTKELWSGHNAVISAMQINPMSPERGSIWTFNKRTIGRRIKVGRNERHAASLYTPRNPALARSSTRDRLRGRCDRQGD